MEVETISIVSVGAEFPRPARLLRYNSRMRNTVAAGFYSALFVALGVFTLSRPAAGADGQKVDFSGSYVLTAIKGGVKMNKGAQHLLRVSQTAGEVEIVTTTGAKQTTNRCSLDGAALPYTTEGGLKGTCSTKFKGKALILETDETSRGNGVAVKIHTKQTWTLSQDRSTLTLRSEVSNPGSGLGDFQVIEPWSEIYSRAKP